MLRVKAFYDIMPITLLRKPSKKVKIILEGKNSLRNKREDLG